MENPIEKSPKLLADQAGKALRAANKYGVEIKLATNTGPVINLELKAMTKAGQDHAWAVSERPALTRALADALTAGAVHGRAVKGAMVKHCGTQFCALWLPLGFTRSLEVPSEDAATIKALLAAMTEYFTKKKEHEVEKMDVTAAQSKALLETIVAAETALQDKDDDIDDKSSAKDAAIETLRGRLRGLISELDQLLDGEDRRWHSFGFNMPSEPDTPGQPKNLVVTPLPNQQAQAECDPLSFAENYRFWIQPHGVSEPQAAGSSREPSFKLENVTPGIRTKVFVSAVNKAGNEGPRSEPVEFTLPSVAAVA